MQIISCIKWSSKILRDFNSVRCQTFLKHEKIILYSDFFAYNSFLITPEFFSNTYKRNRYRHFGYKLISKTDKFVRQLGSPLKIPRRTIWEPKNVEVYILPMWEPWNGVSADSRSWGTMSSHWQDQKCSDKRIIISLYQPMCITLFQLFLHLDIWF